MKSLTAFAVASLLCTSALASQYTSVITFADCKEVARSGSVAGAVGGGMAGAVAGGVVGNLLFGKKGRNLGAALGGVGGGLYGEKAAGTTTYGCVVKFKDPKGQEFYVETVGAQRSVGEVITVYNTPNGVTVR